MDGYVTDEKFLEKEMLKLTDWYTDDLFDSKDDEIIRADFSRIFCDAERFTDDEQEVMAKFGMGVLYEKTDDGKPCIVIVCCRRHCDNRVKGKGASPDCRKVDHESKEGAGHQPDASSPHSSNSELLARQRND
ncbi:MAG: hypothetical protein RLZZ260_929 [Actinomycetota bacterium]